MTRALLEFDDPFAAVIADAPIEPVPVKRKRGRPPANNCVMCFKEKGVTMIASFPIGAKCLARIDEIVADDAARRRV